MTLYFRETCLYAKPINSQNNITFEVQLMFSHSCSMTEESIHILKKKKKKIQIKPTVRNIHIPLVKIFLCTAKLHWSCMWKSHQPQTKEVNLIN